MPTLPPTRQLRAPTTAAHAGAPLNNPEQIRTNLNNAERPDQIGTPSESPPNTPKKRNPEHRSRPPSVIPAQAGTWATSGRSGWGGGAARAGSCLRRYDGKGGAGMTAGPVGERRLAVAAAFHPHLTSPLKGGRDELGEGSGCVGVGAWVPACAGMTERGAQKRHWGAGMTSGRWAKDGWRWLAAFHPPPNLPPKRGEG